MTTSHTPTPCEHDQEWFVPHHGEPLNLENIQWLFSEDQRTITISHSQGKRLYVGMPGEIRKAVNCHDELVEALEHSHKLISQLENMLQDAGEWGDNEQDILERNANVLAKAKENNP